MNYKDIVERINFYRTKRGLSSRELSLRIGKDGAYIGALTYRNFNLPVPVLLDILQVLEVSPAEFFSENFQDFSKDKELLDLFRSLSSDKKESIINLIKK